MKFEFLLNIDNTIPRGKSAFYSFLLFTLLLNSCSSSFSSLYDSNYPLTTENAKAKTSRLTVKIPQGWFTAEDNENNLIDLWLVKDDYSAALNFISMNVDSVTMNDIRGDELNKMIRLSQTFRRAKYGKDLKEFTNQEIFEAAGRYFAAYEYVDNSKRAIRVVVFAYGNKFYELSAVPIKTENPQELYKIQNSVLDSIK